MTMDTFLAPWTWLWSNINSRLSCHWFRHVSLCDQCVWDIVGPEGHYLDFKFTDVAMPWSSNCSNVDHLAFFEQSMDSGPASGGDVNCGGHSASTCQDCPQVDPVTQLYSVPAFSQQIVSLNQANLSGDRQVLMFLCGFVGIAWRNGHNKYRHCPQWTMSR